MEQKRASSKVTPRQASHIGSNSVAAREDSVPSEQETSPAAGRARRPQVANACGHCRAAKVKCTGRRPTCSRCQERDLHCNYDVAEEGVTRGQDVRRRLSVQNKTLEEVSVVLGAMQAGSDHAASELLARLRMGESVSSLYHAVRTSQPGPLRISTEALFGESDPLYTEVGQYLQDPSYVIPDPAQMSLQADGDDTNNLPETSVVAGDRWDVDDVQALDPQLRE